MVLNASLLSVRDRLLFCGIVALTRKNAMLAYTDPEESQAQSKRTPLVPTPTSSLPLSSGDSLADAGTALPRAEVLVHASDSLRLLDGLLGLGEDELDVAGVGHVRVDLRHVSLVVFRPKACWESGKRTRP